MTLNRESSFRGLAAATVTAAVFIGAFALTGAPQTAQTPTTQTGATATQTQAAKLRTGPPDEVAVVIKVVGNVAKPEPDRVELSRYWKQKVRWYLIDCADGATIDPITWKALNPFDGDPAPDNGGKERVSKPKDIPLGQYRYQVHVRHGNGTVIHSPDPIIEIVD